MSVLIGLGVLAIGFGFAALLLSFKWEPLFPIGIGMIALPLLLAGVLVAVAVMAGVPLSDPLKEGYCYRAVRHSRTTVVPVGKVLVPSTTSGIDLEEIRCPA